MPFMAFSSPHPNISTLLCPREGLTLACAVSISAGLTQLPWMGLVSGTHRIPGSERDGPGVYSLDLFSEGPTGWLPLWTKVGLLTSLSSSHRASLPCSVTLSLREAQGCTSL